MHGSQPIPKKHYSTDCIELYETDAALVTKTQTICVKVVFRINMSLWKWTLVKNSGKNYPINL